MWGGWRGAKHDVAVAVNGVIRAVGRTWYLSGRRSEYFAMNVPEASLRSGRNGVEVFMVRRNGARGAWRAPDPSRTSGSPGSTPRSGPSSRAPVRSRR